MSIEYKCARLVDYSSDDELSSEDSDINQNNGTLNVESKPAVKMDSTENGSLPLPSEIQEMFKDNLLNNHVDDPTEHNGKIRSFPHEPGVWPTYVFIEFDPTPECLEFLDEIKVAASRHGIDFEVPDSFHISLSKTVKLRHHWIQPFVDSLKTHLSGFYGFKLMLESIDLYENEEKTRSFCGLKVHFGYDTLLKLVKKVDMCLADFQLPSFYENPSFHISCASCVGSRADESTKACLLPELNALFQSFVDDNTMSRTMWVTKICCKSGNKFFTISLKT